MSAMWHFQVAVLHITERVIVLPAENAIVGLVCGNGMKYLLKVQNCKEEGRILAISTAMDHTLWVMACTSKSLPSALSFVSCLILVLNLSSRVEARTIDDTQSRSTEQSTQQSEALVAGWIAQGERKDFPWQFAVSEPYLYYDQASYVKVRATISLSELLKKGMGHDLHFIVKVADETGQWLDGRIYRHQMIDSKIPKQFSVTFWAPITFRPGQFRIAIIIYDALTERRNVTFRRVTVHPPGSEPFPELLSRLPRVDLDEGRGAPKSFPVATQRPILLDLVIEFSTHVVRKGQLHRLVHTPRVLRPAMVLTRLKLENGCIRVTGLDSLNLRTVIPSQPATGVDLGTVKERIDAEDKDARTKVSVEELETAPNLEAARYFHNELERIIAAPPPCSFTLTPTSTPPVHVVAILTSGVDFIQGTPQPRLESECNCRIFYLRAVPPFQSVFRNNYGFSDMLGPDVIPPRGASPKTIPDIRASTQDPILRPKSDYDRVQDRLKRIVEPLSPRVFEFDGPLAFRPKFFEFIAALKNLSMED